MLINLLDKPERETIYRREALLAAFNKRDNLRRITKKFAWWPARITIKEIVWFEWINVRYPTAKVVDKFTHDSFCIAPEFKHTERVLEDTILLDDDLGMYSVHRASLDRLKPKVIRGPAIYSRILRN